MVAQKLGSCGLVITGSIDWDAPFLLMRSQFMRNPPLNIGRDSDCAISSGMDSRVCRHLLECRKEQCQTGKFDAASVAEDRRTKMPMINVKKMDLSTNSPLP